MQGYFQFFYNLSRNLVLSLLALFWELFLGKTGPSLKANLFTFLEI